jgi:hypothetical protein
MRKPNLVATLVAVCALMGTGSSPAVAGEKAPKIPTSLEGKAYKAVRAKIIAAGWRPDYRAASMEWEQAVQKQYPELRYCALDRPLCSLFFIGKNRACLRVITRGETAEEYRVEAVMRECDNITN